jgi:hypothetical protein
MLLLFWVHGGRPFVGPVYLMVSTV